MKTRTAPTIGLYGGLGAVGLVGLLVLLPLAVLAPLAGAFGFAALALLACAFAASVLHRRAQALTAAHEKLSGEIGLVARRLLKVEAAVAALSERTRPEPPAPAPDAELLAAGIEEVTAEIGLLSGIVRELAGVVAAQEGEIARIRTEPRPAPEPARPVPETVPQTPPQERPPAGSRAPGRDGLPVLRAVRDPEPRPEPAPREAVAEAPPGAVSDAAGDPAVEAAILAACDGEGPEVWLQPVVTLPQRKVVSYEALARLRLAEKDGGAVLGPEAFLPVLERHGRTTALDRRMLRRAATIARHLRERGSAASVAYGLSPLALFDPDFLRSLAGLVSGEADLAGRVMILLPQESWAGLDPEQGAVLAALRGRIGLGLDRAGDLRLDPQGLAERGVSQVKVPASLLLGPAAGRGIPDPAASDLAGALARAGLRLVATGVEAEAQVPDLIDLDLPLAQGGVFAAPRAVRAEVLAPGPAPAPPAREPAPQPPVPPDPRRSFRDFLRRVV